MTALVLQSAVGFEQLSVPVAGGDSIQVAVWYPTVGQESVRPFGPFQQTVVFAGPIPHERRPLVLISHGSRGSLWSHYDTALELARAGFVVAALRHPGDNYLDQASAGNRRDLIERPRQLRRVLDYLLASWSGRAAIDSARIGILGASLGGYGALVAIGGTPNLRQIITLCTERPAAPECQFIRAAHGDQLDSLSPPTPEWVRDTRIRAAVVAAPALGFTFEPNGLRAVTAPVQLWRASDDQQAPNAWNSDVIQKGLPTAPDEHTVAGAGHLVFLAPCTPALAAAVPAMCQDAPGVDRAAFHQYFNRMVVAFFVAHLVRSPGQ